MAFSGDQIQKLIPSRRTVVALVVAWAAYNFYHAPTVYSLSPVITISTGKVQGFISKSRDGKEFYEFLGIPYAKAPIGDLRFEVPEPPANWEGIRSATKYGSECIQVNVVFNGTVTGNEDCLFLNVFVPKVGQEGFSRTPVPVLMYLHGGYFMSGSANAYRPNYFMDEHIVLVTINFRLTSLGFLNTGDGVVRGNMGLKDQTMALKWIQANIAKFGGDPGRVTLFGESAGARAVNFHMLSPMSEGLFHKAISQSGSALAAWSIQPEPKKQALRLFERLNCSKSTIQESVRCMKGLKAETIVATHKEAATPILDHLKMYAPSIETEFKDSKDTFLTWDPKTILTSCQGRNIPWMVGVNSAEGLLITARAMNKEHLRNEFETNYENVFPQIFVYDKHNKDITRKLRKFYFNVEDDARVDFLEYFSNYTNLVSDRLYNEGTKMTAKLQAKYSSVYMYYNKYEPVVTSFDLLNLELKFPLMVEVFWKMLSHWFQRNILRTELMRYGVCHGDELSLLFHFPMVEVTPTSKDFEMSRSLVKLWVQFAYDDTKMKFNEVDWPPISTNSSVLKYMQFSNDATENHLVEEPFKERMAFWESLKLSN